MNEEIIEARFNEVRKVIDQMREYLDQDVDPELDTIEAWANALVLAVGDETPDYA